ncbi:hypothetical protein [Phenylobacterium sp.]|jgi:hypothetical protein|uniref:hypothetical protein n=1 Tax=Phenylobacterium sp. TaxID=1871053 RepID=UPI00262D65AD|nr:hypothetical protein [Phenylobacterium sp.]
MIMWVRVVGALVLTWAALGCLDYLGVTALLGGRSGDDVHNPVQQQTWARDLFWFAIFAVVMATSLLAAARRGAVQLKRALAKS